MTKKYTTCDGNTAAADIAYRFSEVAAIFPITPSSPMGELADAWSAKDRKNLFGEKVKIQEMQSEAGAAGAIHGSLTGGALTTTFTASQGLLLMLPNMFKIAGEMLPTVFHVASRSLAYQALSIYCDHSDVMATRGTGYAILASSNVQEAQDLAVISHLSTLKTSVPFVHFFDGFRTSHQIQKIETISDDILKPMIDQESINKFKRRGIKPETPYAKVGAQNPDVYFQGREAVNKYYDATPEIVKKYMKEFGDKTGRYYELFSYHGAEDATDVIVSMASSTQTIAETVDYLNEKGKKTGVLKIHLYRPFSVKDFVATLPSTVKRIAVLDRTKEAGSVGEPIYLDVMAAIKSAYQENKTKINPDKVFIIGGRYGLSSKEFTPTMVNGVFKHLENKGFNGFTVGIEDDVTHKSINISEDIHTEPKDLIRCKFWGYGSDGTVSANKNSIKIIGEKTDLNVQGHFVYDSKKSGGVTVSHLRFGKGKITSEYEVTEADIIALHKPAYIGRYDVLEGLKEGGVFLINSELDVSEVFESFTKQMQDYIRAKKIKVYTINAFKIARNGGLLNKINTIMQVAFFELSKVMKHEEFIAAIKEFIEKQFAKKGMDIVEKNWAVVDKTLEELKEVPILSEKETTKCAPEVELIPDSATGFVKEVIKPIMHMKGDSIKVSEMTYDGIVPTATTKLEKRGIATEVPEWVSEECIQCGICAFVCPHAAIRIKQMMPDSLKDADKNFEVLKSMTKNDKDLMFKVQVYPYDCTGCNICYEACPKKGKALKMVPLEKSLEAGEGEKAEFFDSLPDVTDGTNQYTIKGSQMNSPLIEFSGACAGCGETPIIKLVTQLYGDRMIVANATGCSTIFGGTFPTIPYCKTKDGKGPSWANSLFEDNAEYGLGMKLAVEQNRALLKTQVENLLKSGTTKELSDELIKMLENWDKTDEEAKAVSEKIKTLIPKALKEVYGDSEPFLKQIDELKDYFIDKSLWIIGGDGWAYDIGFGGLDHVLAQGKNVNVLVLDNEQYANTGGQASKATPRGSTAKFAIAGKELPKKNLGMMMMTYGYIYVAHVSLTNKMQLIKAIKEAEEFDGPSLIIAYSTCIAHGFDLKTTEKEQKLAIDSGYLPLYRYNPALIAEGKDPLSIDSGEAKADFEEFMHHERRYTALEISDPKRSERLHNKAKQDNKDRSEMLKHFHMDASKNL